MKELFRDMKMKKLDRNKKLKENGDQQMKMIGIIKKKESKRWRVLI